MKVWHGIKFSNRECLECKQKMNENKNERSTQAYPEARGIFQNVSATPEEFKKTEEGGR